MHFRNEKCIFATHESRRVHNFRYGIPKTDFSCTVGRADDSAVLSATLTARMFSGIRNIWGMFLLATMFSVIAVHVQMSKVALPFPAFCMANEAEGNGLLMPWSENHSVATHQRMHLLVVCRQLALALAHPHEDLKFMNRHTSAS